MTSIFPLVKGATARVTFPIYDSNSDFLSGAAGLDSEYSQDGGVFSDCTNEATEMTSGGVGTGIYYLDLTATETNCDLLTIQVKTTSPTGKTTALTYPTAAQNLDTIDSNIDTIVGKLPTHYIMGSSDQNDNDTVIDAIKAKTDNLPASPAPASEYDTEMGRITADVATEAKQDIIDTNVDTIVTALPTNKIMGSSDGNDYNDEITGIKSKTDNLPASPAPSNEYDTAMAHITADVATEAKQDTIDTVVDAIKLKTDNLPASPAPSHEYDVEMAHITADVATEAKQDIIDGIVDDIKLKTDNLPASPAPSHEYDTEASRITADVATEAKQDIIDTNVDTVITALPDHYIMGSSVQTDKDDEIDAIKLKTDNLPASPAPSGEYDTNMTLLVQLLKNKYVVDVANSKIYLYDDAGTSVLLTWDALDKNGNPISVATGVPTQRGKPV